MQRLVYSYLVDKLGRNNGVDHNSITKSAINVFHQDPQHPFDEHSHDFYELVLVKSGSALHFYDGKAIHVSKGSVIFINKEESSHFFDKIENLCLINVLCMPTELKSNILKLSLNEHLNSASGQFFVPHKTIIQSDSIIKQITTECQQQDEFSSDMVESLLYQLLILLHRSRNQNKMDQDENMDNTYSLLNFIHEHYQNEIDWLQLADNFNFSQRTLNRKLLDHTGLTPQNYLSRVRLCVASERLVTSTDAVTDIAFSVGFNDSNYFSNKFQQMFSMSPTQYRKTHCNNRR